jgi:small-conductance mechanosensitive channel
MYMREFWALFSFSDKYQECLVRWDKMCTFGGFGEMSEETQAGVRNGIYWRFLGLSVIGIAVLQVIALYAMHYLISQSLPLAELIVAYLVIPRAKERRLTNALIGVLASFVIGVLLEIFLEKDLQAAIASHQVMSYVEMFVLFPLILGLIVSYAYLRLTEWSEKKRATLEEKRRKERAETAPVPVRRHTRKGKKKNSRRR